jgi:predicted ATP-grasp superfamily ATP-dependent carboligase
MATITRLMIGVKKSFALMVRPTWMGAVYIRRVLQYYPKMVNNFSDVLITDGHWRKTLAATRALGRSNLSVTVGESTFLSTAGFSRYCHHRLVYPSAFIEPLAFIDFLSNYCRKNAVKMLLPMEDHTMELLAAHRERFKSITALPIASTAKLYLARDKGQIIRLAQNLGIPVPKTWFIRDLAELSQIKHKLPYPVVIKPKRASGAMGVAYPRNSQELVDQYRAIHRHYPFPLIQEKIPSQGPGYGASFLLDQNSSIKAAFVHKRLREYPVSGGASTARISTKNDQIRDMAVSLLKTLDWFGIAMVEFKMDPRDNTPKLMELNPRFWGSLALAIESGVNFPYLLYKMALGQSFKPVETYQIGVTCRWLLPGDLLHYIHNPQRRKISKDFFRFNANNLYYDIVSLTDPLPTMAKLLTPLTFLYDPDMQARMKARRGLL